MTLTKCVQIGKPTLTFVLILLLNCIFAFKESQNADFSGVWSRNSDKSNPGGLSINSIPLLLEITQSDSGIKIKRISKNKLDSTFMYTETLNFDGTKSLSSPKAGMKKSSSFVWGSDHNEFIDNGEFMNDQGTLLQRTQDTWSLKNGGKTLKIISVLNVDGETYTLTEVFDKK